jgi:RNA polymerase sigma-70 factor (ECF subfamily)
VSDFLAEQFEGYRGHLRAVAFRMLGSHAEAEDAVQEAWLRLSRADASQVDNLGGWLTTVVGRVCLDMLRSRKSRREEPMDERVPEPRVAGAAEDPEQAAVMADSVGLALLVVLETLQPTERLAFVLHDLFGVPFEEIGPIVGRTPAAARQLASRARRRVQGVSPNESEAANKERQQHIVQAFLKASRDGDMQGLLALLDPDVVLRADAVTVRMGAPAEVRGLTEVATTFAGRAKAVQAATVDGGPGAVWLAAGRPRMAFVFTFAAERIVGIEMVADPARLEQMEVVPLSD